MRFIDQSELDALTEELMMEAFRKDSEGITAKIYRNIHYSKFAEEAKRRLGNDVLDQRIKVNQEWCQRHSFNMEEFEVDFRELLKKHHVSYMAFYKDSFQVSLANSRGSFHIEGTQGPERERPEDLAHGYSDAWIASAYTRDS